MSKIAPSSPVRSRRLLLVVATIALFVLAALWIAKPFFALNKVEFLLNQREYQKALTKLQHLKTNGLTNARTASLETQARVLSGDIPGALTAARELPLTPEGFYWLSLAQHQAGETTASQNSARQFLQSGQQLPNGANAIALALAGKERLSSPPDLDGNPFRMMFPLEQAVYLAFVADQQLELGNVDLAARLYKESLIRGNFSIKSMRRAAYAAALTADLNSANLFASLAGERGLDHIVQHLEQRRGRVGQARLSVQGEDLIPGGRQIDTARGLAWAIAAIAKRDQHMSLESSATLTRIVAENPDDPSIRCSLAEATAATGNTAAASQIYQQLQKTDPSYEIWLRLHADAKTPDQLSSASASFLNQLHPVANISGSLLRLTEYELPARGDKEPVVAATFSVPDQAGYGISIVARSTESRTGASASPSQKAGLFYLWIDDEVAGIARIASSDWTLSTVRSVLEPGLHTLHISPVTAGHPLPEVDMVLITRAGA